MYIPKRRRRRVRRKKEDGRAWFLWLGFFWKRRNDTYLTGIEGGGKGGGVGSKCIIYLFPDIYKSALVYHFPDVGR